MKKMKAIAAEYAFERLLLGGVLVTANRRLSRYLTEQFNQYQLSNGQAVWETPNILPYKAWLKDLYSKIYYLSGAAANELPLLLSQAQEQYIWESIIRESNGNSLLQVSETARLAMDAWEICNEWSLPISEIDQLPSEDTRSFLNWAKNFEQKCKEKRWLGNANLPELIHDHFQAGYIFPPPEFILAGFDELSPGQLKLIYEMEACGSRLFNLVTPGQQGQAFRGQLGDRDDEIKAAAAWARARLDENKDSRIGIIVPDLQEARPSIVRYFDDAFHPSMKFDCKSSLERVYNISLGLPLHDYPLITSALVVLKFANRSLSVDEYSQFLRSPFFEGSGEEIAERALLDALIRKKGETEISAEDLVYFSAKHASREYHPAIYCPLLNGRLVQFNKVKATAKGSRLPSEWVEVFSGLLNAIGWPGWDRSDGYALNSEEFQTVNAWYELLHLFATLERVCGKMSIRAALSRLTQMAGQKIFQPETKDLPVQIMGMLEAAGEKFDYMWIMGLDAESWPHEPRPNPFLPIWLQKKYNVPHASPEREYEFSRKITRRLLNSADNVFVSYPKKDEDTVLSPSPLITDLEAIELEQEGPGWWQQIFETAAFEKIEDHQGPEAGFETRISGGTGLLKFQATCPFSAFAAYRLKAEALEIPEPGLNARERGSLVHNALELFWEEVKTLEALKRMSEKQISANVSHAVDHALAKMMSRHPGGISNKDRFAGLERQRIISLLVDYLAVDRERAPFTVIDREKKLVCNIAGIELKTYADRIDQLEDGQVVIVDYKTGEPTEKDWFTDRIAEPQLPLYSIAVKEKVAGVVFAQVKKGNIRYLGIAERDGIIPGAGVPGVKKSPVELFPTIEKVKEVWQQKIEMLVNEIKKGIAAVDPVSIAKSCRYCDYGPVCRIGEANFLET
jgi:probable DNA repair protein